MTKHQIYKTLYDEEFEINSLPPECKAAYLDIKGFYDKKPDWCVFGNYWHAKVDFVFKRKTKRDMEKKINSALWRIAEDLESRLGIEQGHVRPTDDTDRLFAAIIKEFGYDRRVWKKAENLIETLDKLGYKIKFKKKIGNSARKKIRGIGPTQRKISPDRVAKALRAEKIPFKSAPPFVKYGCWKKLKGGEK